MRKRTRLLTLATLPALLIASSALARTPLCTCFDDRNGTITCKGGFFSGNRVVYPEFAG